MASGDKRWEKGTKQKTEEEGWGGRSGARKGVETTAGEGRREREEEKSDNSP